MAKLIWIALTKEWPTSVAGLLLFGCLMLHNFGYMSEEHFLQASALITTGGLIASKSVKQGD